MVHISWNMSYGQYDMDHIMKHFVMRPVIYTFQDETLDKRNFNTKQKSKFGYKALKLNSML